MAKKTGNRFNEILDEYKKKYDIDSLDSPNDKANLTAFINIQILVEKLQAESEALSNTDIIQNIDTIQKINSAIEKQLERGLQLERALGLDRKSRASDKVDNVAVYINNLKQMAHEYLDKQFIRVSCPSCNILVGRIIPVMEHTAFECHFQCSQCGRKVSARRSEKDIFFDFDPNDREWRKKHGYKVIQPPKTALPDIKSDAQLLITDETENEEEINGTSEENQ